MPDIECINLKGTERRLLDHVKRTTASGPSADIYEVGVNNNEAGLVIYLE